MSSEARAPAHREQPRLLCRMLHWLGELCGCRDEPGPIDDLAGRCDAAIRRATDFLIARQDEDGAWRSADDPDLANGHAMTAHVLRALRAVPQPPEVGDAVARGFDFIETVVGDGDVLDFGPTELPYPTTAAAGALSLLSTSRRRRARALVPVLVRYLCRAQYAEDAKYGPQDIEYGGFGYRPAHVKGDPSERVPELDYPHLSACIFAIEALVLSGDPAARPALDRARAFVERCQNHDGSARAADDGGFVFSPAIAELNKAGPSRGSSTGFRSYGTTTCNGLRLLALLGCDAQHPRFRAAADWLRRSFRANAVPGEFAPDRAEAQASIYYYYVWTASHALDLLGRPTIDTPAGRVEWARELATQLVDRQLADGMWRNVAAARKENVIPIGDIVSLPALALCRKYLVPQARQ